MSLTEDLRGVTPPLVTPFSNGTVDHDALADVIEHAVAGGVAGLFPNGTTGEFASLSATERAAVVETTVATAPDDTPVLAGVADTAIPDVLAHADRAADVGADAVVVTPPYFHGPNAGAAGGGSDGSVADGDDGLRRFFETIADASPLPVFAYDIPSCTGTKLPTETVVALADHPNVLGLKDSSGDFGGFCTLLRETPDDFLLLQGFDNLLLPSLRMGADGGVHALSNVVPDAFSTLYAVGSRNGQIVAGHQSVEGDAVEEEANEEEATEKEAAEEIHAAVGTLFDRCLDLGFAPATKAALVELDVIEGRSVRPPLVAVSGSSVREPLGDVASVV